MSRRVDTSDGGFWADTDAEAALQRFKTLVNTVDDGIYQLDAGGRFVAVNDVIAEMTGYGRDDLLGEHVSILLDDDLVERISQAIYQSLSTGQELDETYELDARTSDGDSIPCELQVSLLFDGDTFDGTVGIVRDISDRVRTERRLVEREEQLQRERDLTSQILETSPVGIQVLDADGDVTRMNERLREILEISDDEARSYDPSDRTVYDETGAELPPDRHPFGETLRTGEPVYDRTLQVELPSGDRHWLSVNAAPLLDDEGDIDRVVTTGEDVTELKERERTLERRRDELATELEEIYGRIRDGVIALDEDWTFTHLNESAESILDVSDEDLLGEEIWSFFPELVDTEFERRYRQAMATQETVSFEAYYEPYDAWFEEHVYPSETGLSVYFRDVTEHRERERELERSEQRYRTLAEYFPNGLVTLFDDDLEYTLAAGLGFDRIPVEPEDLEGNRVDEVWPAETWAALEPAFRAALDGSERTVELSYADREWILHAVPISDDDGDVFAGMTMAQDITERKERERDLEETVEELEASNARLERFAYAASHDLQEPLRMVSSYLQLLEHRCGDALDEEGGEYLEFAVDGADRMREMVEGLLAYSRVETRSGDTRPVDLDSVLTDATDVLQMQIQRSDVEITSEELPRVLGDENQLLQVLQNLLDNAITYSGDDPPEIHVAAERRGEECVVSVSDDGMGIDPDDQDDVFTVFNRLHGGDEFDGTGIGLALCERIVENHGGEIWVESEPGEGSTFSFTLPAVDD
ncbi:PAS domain S-box protein [Natronomonas salina]|uniref:PAS domain-containing sensor histidine kinase n=1 Tax=Natronomonas salina TaxID=1710540 RepID=UPI0015B423D0|nr:PAS domain-containing protein [Natronomonas salina]QLD88184.1 PAS domain S-box protein [Natronomonas salina]